MIMLACMDAAGGLGFQGGLPWHVPAELAHFKAFTMGKTLGVGRGTTLPPLPGRDVVYLSRAGVSLNAFFNMYEHGVVIGGATIFDLCLRKVDTIVLSVLPDTYHCDCFLDMVTIERLFRLELMEQEDGFQVLTFTRRQNAK